MAINKNNTGVLVGVDRFHVAKMLTDEPGSAPTYDTPKPFPGINEISINPNTESTSIFYDDGVADTFTSLGEIEVTVTKSLVSTEEEAYLLGHEVDSVGGIIYSPEDVAPNVAVMFRTQMSNGKFKYHVLYKGKFGDGEETYTGKTDSIEAQQTELTGAFAKTTGEFTLPGNKKKSLWKYKLDETVAANPDSASDPTISACKSWFTEVPVPSTTTQSLI